MSEVTPGLLAIQIQIQAVCENLYVQICVKINSNSNLNLPSHDGGYSFGSHSIFETYNLAIGSRIDVKSIH